MAGVHIGILINWASSLGGGGCGVGQSGTKGLKSFSSAKRLAR